MAEQLKQEQQVEQLLAQYIGAEDEGVEESTYEEAPLPLSYKGIVNDDLEGIIPYDLDKFKKGVKDYSYLAGAFSALRNSGMSEENAMKWLFAETEVKCLDKQLASQEKVAEVTAEASVKAEL